MNNLKMEIIEEVVHATFLEKINITLEYSKMIVEERLKFQEGRKYPLFMDYRVVSMTIEARDYMKKEGIEGVSAGAFLSNNIINSTILNFFLKVSKPKVPAKIFTKKEDAIMWLQQYK